MPTKTEKEIRMNSGIQPLGTTELLLVAEQIVAGKSFLAEEMVPAMTRQLIEIYETPFSESYTYRCLVAKAAGVLASHYPEALALVMESACRYAEIERNLDDADPYRPNGVTVLGEDGLRCEGVAAFLTDILKTCPGMADADVKAALAAMGA